MFFVLVSAPFVLLIRLLHPIKKVRFIHLDAGRIGHFDQANIYWARKINGEFPPDILDIVYFHVGPVYKVANPQYLKMWKRTLRTVPMIFSHFLAYIDKLNKNIFLKNTIYNGDRIDQKLGILNNRISGNILSYTIPPIYFTSDENVLGEKLLPELGIPKGNQFICFHARESAYLDKIYSNRNWSYHDFRDSNIRNYLPAVEEMTKRKYYAVRMGSHVKHSLDVDNPKIIDYATNGRRSDFLDIYLSANCRFFLLSDTGLSNPPEVFRKPIVYVNNFLFPLICRLSVQNCIFIFKKYYLVQEKRFLTYAEIAQTDLLYCYVGHTFRKKGIEVVENTQEEILAATIEMEKRLSGVWVPQEEDEALQTQFWSMFPSEMSKSPNCRIGAQFLRDNRELLKFPSNSKLDFEDKRKLRVAV